MLRRRLEDLALSVAAVVLALSALATSGFVAITASASEGELVLSSFVVRYSFTGSLLLASPVSLFAASSRSMNDVSPPLLLTGSFASPGAVTLSEEASLTFTPASSSMNDVSVVMLVVLLVTVKGISDMEEISADR